MDNVVSINSGRTVGRVNDKIVEIPHSRRDYLNICKKFLTVEDYEELLLCIMDEDYYNNTEQQIAKVVDSYFSFVN
jgi:hypothetical protein